MKSLVWATDIDVLPPDREMTRTDGAWVIRCPSNSGFYWGNMLIFDAPPQTGDRDRWLRAFATEFPDLNHCTLAWDETDGSIGAAVTEFPDFELERTVGLVTRPGQLAHHPRANPDVVVQMLDPDDDAGWDQVMALWVAINPERDRPQPAAAYADFALGRLADLRVLFRLGRGAWFVALDGDLVVGSLGVVVTDGRARYQSVDTRPSHRRRGIASRLVVEAGQRAAAGFGPVSSLVIAADPGYHALSLYESLGFERVEEVCGVCHWPTTAPADSGQ